MNKSLLHRYYPLTVPHAERLRNWRCIQTYCRTTVAVRDDGVSRVDYRIPSPVESAKGKRLLFISDVHYRGGVADQRRVEAIKRLAGAFEPDMLLLGGDLLGDAVDLGALPAMLEVFRTLAPVSLAVQGNWARGKEWIRTDCWRDLLESHGITFLCNSGWSDDAMFVYGVDDLLNGAPRLPANWRSDRFNLLLSHRPDTVISLDSGGGLDGVSLALCGHTHGGQVRLPLIGPIFASSMYGCKLAYGMFVREGGMRMIVSSGISNLSMPLRFNCRREVLAITLV
ncbi:MAG: hypothetical protein PHI35_01330 [Victivallaceae bacterium]|nr:hypothetical protein [Victivallaceae bacterium]